MNEVNRIFDLVFDSEKIEPETARRLGKFFAGVTEIRMISGLYRTISETILSEGIEWILILDGDGTEIYIVEIGVNVLLGGETVLAYKKEDKVFVPSIFSVVSEDDAKMSEMIASMRMVRDRILTAS